MLRSALFFAGLAASVALLACTSSDPGPSCKAYTTTADLKNPTVSFKNDVMPIFQQSCTFTSCHGGGTGKVTMVQGDPSKTRAALVGIAAPENPTMMIVAAGDPANSWLMKKVDGDVCLFSGKCTTIDGKCDDTMPQGNELLDVGQRDVIRRWIAQGAADN